MIVQFLPFALVGPMAGGGVDRVNRRTLMIVADVVRGSVVLGLLLVSIELLDRLSARSRWLVAQNIVIRARGDVHGPRCRLAAHRVSMAFSDRRT